MGLKAQTHALEIAIWRRMMTMHLEWRTVDVSQGGVVKESIVFKKRLNGRTREDC